MCCQFCLLNAFVPATAARALTRAALKRMAPRRVLALLQTLRSATEDMPDAFRTMPVMRWGTIISDKRYRLSDWRTAAAFTGGVTELILTGSLAAKRQHGTFVHRPVQLMGSLKLGSFTFTFKSGCDTQKYDVLKIMRRNLRYLTLGLYSAISQIPQNIIFRKV